MDFNPTTANTTEILNFLNRAFAKADNGFNAYNDNNQIYIEDKSGNKTSTFIIPTHEERIITEKHSDTFVEIQLYNTGLISDAVKIKTTQLYSQKKLESLFGVKAFRRFEDYDWKQLFNIIRCLLIETPQSITYSTLGWSDNNANFLYGNIKITSAEVVAIKSNLVQQAPNITDISANDACAFIEQIMNNLCNNCFVSYTLLSYYILSLLKSRFYADFRFCPSFALAIVGKSGTGKTSTVMPLMNPLALETSCFEDSMASIRQTFGKRVGDNTVCTGMAVFTGEECPNLQTSSFPRLLLMNWKVTP